MIRLHGGITLHLEKGATLLGIRDETAYPILREKPFGEKPGVIRALLHAESANDITLEGDGLIDGGFPEALGLIEAAATFFRPELLYFRDCRNVTIRNLTIRNSGFWCLHLMHCTRVRMRGLTIRNPLDRINTDGIDPDGCQHVDIVGCDIETGDDCIVLKSTEGRPCEHITIRDCILRTNHGALKIGTEAMGPIRHVKANNCTIPSVGARKTSAVGIALYMKDGSSYEHMHFNGIRMEQMDSLAIMIDNRPRYYQTDQPGMIRDITFEDIIISGRGRLLIEGRPESPIRELRIHQLRWNLDDYGMDQAKPLGSARTKHNPDLPDYLSSPQQFIIAHASNLELSSLSIQEKRSGNTPDRGLFHLRDIHQARIINIESNMDTGEHEVWIEDDCSAIKHMDTANQKDYLEVKQASCADQSGI